MKKNLKTTLLIFSCVVRFSVLFGAANGDQPESMQEISRRYQAAQTLRGLFHNPEASTSAPSSSTSLFDDAGARKKTERSENDNQGEPPKFQRIIEDPAEFVEEVNHLNQAYYLEELKYALRINNLTSIYNAIHKFLWHSIDSKADQQFLSRLPEFKAFINQNKLAGNYNVLNAIYDLLPIIDMRNEVIYAVTGKNPPEFIDFMNQKLHEGDFFTTHNFTCLLPPGLRANFFIKIKGTDSQEVLYLSPYIATRYSNALKSIFSPERIAAAGFERTPLTVENIPLRALRTITELFNKAETAQGLKDETIDSFVRQWMSSGFLAHETLETIYELFNAANALDVVPLIKNILAHVALLIIRTDYDFNFELLNNVSENDRELIAKASFIDWPEYTGIFPEGYLKEDAWRNQHHIVSVADYAPYIHPKDLTFLFLNKKNIASLEGLSAIPNPASRKLLDLSDNRLTTLPPDAFEGLDNLQTLDVSNNPIESISFDMFNHLPKLTEIKIGGTPLAQMKLLRNRIGHKVEEITGRRPRIVTHSF